MTAASMLLYVPTLLLLVTTLGRVNSEDLRVNQELLVFGCAAQRACSPYLTVEVICLSLTLGYGHSSLLHGAGVSCAKHQRAFSVSCSLARALMPSR